MNKTLKYVGIAGLGAALFASLPAWAQEAAAASPKIVRTLRSSRFMNLL